MSAADAAIAPRDPLHAGMPAINRGEPELAFFEFWPPGLFYFPAFVFWALQSLRYRSFTLPTVANPGIAAGGLCGESKSELLGSVGPALRALVPPYVVIDKPSGADASARALAMAKDALAEAGIALPLVAKPDIGCRGAGVKLVRTDEALADYIRTFPDGTRFLLQTLVTAEGEAGVFYVRYPGEAKGRIPSLTLKYFPHLVGDGRRTLEQLIRDDPRAGRISHVFLRRHAERLKDIPAAGERVRLVFSGNHARGTIFRDGTPLVTEALRAKMDEIANDIEGFCFGRFDIKFADFDEFLAGRGFHVLEFNGAGAEQTHMWDSQHNLWDAYRILIDQYDTLFKVAAANRKRGAKPMSLPALIRRFQHEQKLTKAYPPTD